MEIFSVLAKADKIKKIKAYERKLYMDNISRKKCVQINITLPPPPSHNFLLGGTKPRKLRKKRRMKNLFSSRKS